MTISKASGLSLTHTHDTHTQTHTYHTYDIHIDTHTHQITHRHTLTHRHTCIPHIHSHTLHKDIHATYTTPYT